MRCFQTAKSSAPIWEMMMLEVKNLSAAYSQHPSLNDVSINVLPGEIVAILGANGAGKSTLLRAIAGICEGTVSGKINFGDISLVGLSSDEIVEKGLALVPEGRGIFADLTVKENLLLGAHPARAKAKENENLHRVFELFPKLQERQRQVVRTMSGGEQQMVAIGRAMMSAPIILMLDEPSLGLSPLLCKELFRNLAQIKTIGIGVLLVEQNAKQSLAIADRGYLLENTRITHKDSAERLLNNPVVQKAYLGASGNIKKIGTTTEIKATPAAPRFDTMPIPQRSADQYIDGSVDDLVEIAAKISAEVSRQPNAETVNTVGKLTQSRIKIIIKNIETAAAAARIRPREVEKSSAETANAIPTQSGSDAGASPVSIEIYKKPIVEVYRRRPTGQFERD